MVGRFFDFLRGSAMTGADPDNLEQGYQHPDGAWGEYDEDYDNESSRKSWNSGGKDPNGLFYGDDGADAYYDKHTRDAIEFKIKDQE